MTRQADIWQGVLVGGVGLAVVSLLTDGVPKPRRPNASTGAPSDTGAPVPAVGGVSDYMRVYLAQRIQCQADNGRFPEQGTNGFDLPVTPRLYAFREVVTYWQLEVNRLLGLDKAGPLARRCTLTQRPATIADALGSPLLYNGKVSLDSAELLLRAWERFASKCIQALAGDGPVLDKAHAQLFWDVVERLAIDVNVDRATPDRSIFRDAWSALYDSVLDLPGTLGAAARKIAEKTAEWTVAALWAFAKPIVFSPLGVGALAVTAYVLREPINTLVRKVR